MFFSPWDAWVCGPASGGNQDILSLNNLGHIIIANKLNFMRREQLC